MDIMDRPMVVSTPDDRRAVAVSSDTDEGGFDHVIEPVVEATTMVAPMVDHTEQEHDDDDKDDVGGEHPDDTAVAVMDASIAEPQHPPAAQQQQQPQPSTVSSSKPSSVFSTKKNQFRAIMSRAVHDTKKVTTATSTSITPTPVSVPNRMKEQTKRTTQSVATAMHHVSDQIRTMKTKVGTNFHKMNDNTNSRTAGTGTGTGNDAGNAKGTNHQTNASKDSVLPLNPRDTAITDTGRDKSVACRDGDGMGFMTNTKVVPDTTTAPTATRHTTKTTSSTASTGTNAVFTVHPILDFMTADLTLICIFTSSAALYPLFQYYHILFKPMVMVESSSTLSDAATAATTTMTPFFILSNIGVPWMIAAFTLGLAIGQYDYPWLSSFFLFTTSSTTGEDYNDRYPIADDIVTSNETDVHCSSIPLPLDATTAENIGTDSDMILDSMTKKKHTLFMTLLGSKRSARIQFRNNLLSSNTTSNNPKNDVIVKNQLHKPVKVWTTLTNRNHKKDPNTGSMDDSSTLSMTTTATTTTTTTSSSIQVLRSGRRLPWQRQMTPTEDGYLMQHLLKHESFRRIIAVRQKPTTAMIGHPTDTAALPTTIAPTATTAATMNEGDKDTTDETYNTQLPTSTAPTPQLGSFDLTGTKADTLEGYVVAPLFQLRGMDIFLSEDIPEMEASTHPYLLENGLRSVPTFIVNVLTQWGNIFIYFEMSKWVHGFEMIVHESDPDEVKALKVCSFSCISCMFQFCFIFLNSILLLFCFFIVARCISFFLTGTHSLAILKWGCQLSQ
jgi:hypothetical protein